MKRLLCLTAGMNAGGAETFLMKIFRKLDRSKYMMDFCVTVTENYYEQEIKELGGKMYVIPPKSKNPVKTFCAIRRIVKDNQYDYVIRVCENALSTLDLLAAKCGGAKHLIMRSSNADSASAIVRVLHKVFFFLPRIIPNVKLAPSKLAAEYTFGRKAVQQGKVYLLHNGINTVQFRFSQEVRDEVRQQLDADGKIVIGHVGRFNQQKNHRKLIEVFAEYQKMEPESELWLVGIGNLEEEIRECVKDLGLENAVKFLGLRNDVNRLLMGMDAFIFPSFYEGMPNTVIEAQATGLHCLISDTITPEADVNGYVRFLSLDAPAQQWAQNAKISNSAERTAANDLMRERGYEISDVVENFIGQVFET